MRGSRGFRAAAEHIVKQLRDYGIKDARIEQFPADGKIFYGTQKSRPAWDAEFAELWELREVKRRLDQAHTPASWDAMPVTLAQDSESGEATAELVDVNNGTSESDYAGKDVRGKIVLAAAQPGAVALSQSNVSAQQASLVTHRTNAPRGGAKMKTSCAGDTSTRLRLNRRLLS